MCVKVGGLDKKEKGIFFIQRLALFCASITLSVKRVNFHIAPFSVAATTATITITTTIR